MYRLLGGEDHLEEGGQLEAEEVLWEMVWEAMVVEQCDRGIDVDWEDQERV